MNNPNQTKYKSETAELLLKLKAIKLQPNDPFTWASGWKSPIYCDNRIILSNIGCRNKIANYFSQLITEKYKDVDVIAGVATGAIGIGILVAEKLNLPFIYVRPEAKKHGRQNQIEGEVSKGKKIIVIEDLISTGKSSLNAVKALREAELDVLGMIAIFTYDFEVSKDNFLKDSVKLNTLSNYSELLKKAVEINYVSKKDVETLEKWNKSPESWS
ncbi:MAG: orotate phosphoribosyltransferase [Flavobacteriaceae bacterium]|nr:orotate phosphoribosyltransferase [Flavobacteriaceae bacterium]|tara:strand:- start:690 stop:1334 length:645 start_codon:yes stop_codon:yes gene_type:complete